MSWKDRLKQEYLELRERYEKLRRLKNKYDAGIRDIEALKKDSMWILEKQLEAMTEYMHWLEVRLEQHGIEY